MSGASLVLATRNPGKLVELQRIMAEAVPGIRVLGLSEVGTYPESPETGATFADNAIAKALEAAEHTGLPCVADDSGIEVDALNGMPGVLSARWSGRHGEDQANTNLLLAQLKDVPEQRRGAAFACAAAFVVPGAGPVVVVERMPGRVIREQRGRNGFGYDPVFVPSGMEVTTAELGSADKDAISHRGKAFRALAPEVAARLGPGGS